MIIRRDVKLLKPILAARPPRDPRDPDARREFDTISRSPKEVCLPFNLPRWEWAFLEARDGLGY